MIRMERKLILCQLCSNIRHFSTSRRVMKFERLPRSVMFIRPDKVNADPEISEQLAAGKMVFRKHPGKTSIGAVHPPREFERSLIKSSGDIELKSLVQEAKKLNEYLAHRQLPLSDELLRKKRDKILRDEVNDAVLKYSKKIKSATGGSPTDEELNNYIEEKGDWLKKKVESKLRKITYNWKPIDYKTEARCLVYALSRFSADFAVLCRIFNEIKLKTNFFPRSVFDFGSGVGSTIWAVESVWNRRHKFRTTHVEPHDEEEAEVSETDIKLDDDIDRGDSEPDSLDRSYFCVDASAQMIELANRLIRDGDSCGQVIFPRAHLYFRQFLPALPDPKYDLVVSSFSLMEIPHYEERMRIALNLWHKTNDYLVFVEQGNRYGFTLLMEIRDYILSAGQEIHRQELVQLLESRQMDTAAVRALLDDKQMNNAEKYEAVRNLLQNFDLEIPTLAPVGHVLAPCPHEFGCPRMRDVLPCKFQQAYFEPQLTGSKEQKLSTQPFSYLILGKGSRQDAKASTRYSNELDWPRLVRPVLLRRRLTLCEMCTSQGLLSETTVTRNSAGREAYRLVRNSQWGDTWPATLDFSPASFERMQRLAKQYVEQRMKERDETEETNDFDNSDDDDYDDASDLASKQDESNQADEDVDEVGIDDPAGFSKISAERSV